MATLKSFDGGEFDGYLALPAGGYGPGIVVLQEIFGVNEYMRSVCDWYAAHGFVALCPDLFWRQERGVQLTDQNKTGWEKAIALYKGLDEAKAVEDSAAAVESGCCAGSLSREISSFNFFLSLRFNFGSFLCCGCFCCIMVWMYCASCFRDSSSVL